MDLWQLHIFCKVIELKSFSKAGEAAHLSQPTVSSHIRDLEEHFNCRLIDRLAKEALPTKAGEMLYGYARRLITLREEAETALSLFHGKMKGRLIIGGSTIPGAYVIPRLIGSFKTRYPDVIISLMIGDTEKIINATLSGELEIGIVGARTENKKISQQALIDDEMCLVVPAKHRWALKKKIEMHLLLKEPFIIRERGSGTLKSFEQNLSGGDIRIEDFNVVAEMGSTEAVCQAVKNGVGVSIVSRIAVSEELNAGTLKAITIAGFNLRRSFYLTLHKYRSLSPLGNTFVEHIRKELQ
ncbi:MAG: selenium metabolism-associated LysR family transcriptional regulator [Thermodesulfobacteriota bacterium]